MAQFSFLDYRGQRQPRAAGESETSFDPLRARRRWLRPGRHRRAGRYVLYWMQMYKRAQQNPALTEAIRIANHLDLPVVVYEGLNYDYPEANARIHRFILECARDTAAALKDRGIRYVFYLQRNADDTRAAAAEMMREAAYVVVDDFPAFILPVVTRKAMELTEDSGVPVLAIDGNGVAPLAEIPKQEVAARTIRPKLHRLMPSYLFAVPELDPKKDSTHLDPPVRGIESELRDASDAKLDALVAGCDINMDVLPSLRLRGGRRAALAQLEAFASKGLPHYGSERNNPSNAIESNLSPYLHFGCLAPQEIALRALNSKKAPDEAIDAFLEQLIVRRELSYNFCWHNAEHTTLKGLPNWAKETLAAHRHDTRAPIYDEATMERGATEDVIWNAAQRELVATGKFHNYLRMLWGKNIIRWTHSYEQAQEFMIRMHHKYALDGRNPNTYANILWCFGLHDRAFQERDILGKLRPLNSKNTAKKFKLDGYYERVDNWVQQRQMPILR